MEFIFYSNRYSVDYNFFNKKIKNDGSILFLHK